MNRTRKSADASLTDLDGALAALSADALRDVVHDMLLELDDRTHARVVASLISRAARTGSGWTPPAVSHAQVTEVLAFVKAAESVGQADPSKVDESLRRGSAAFLRKDYADAHRIFGALLPSLGDGSIDLGQHESVGEVLGSNVTECAVQYVVAAYMVTPMFDRAEAVRAAIGELKGVHHFWEPLHELQRVSLDPLPELNDFLPRWRMLIASSPANERAGDGDTREDRWLREVVQVLEGAKGLARIARASKRADDLRAWCTSLVDAHDWEAALRAFEEAAELFTNGDFVRGEFLDGAALAAWHLSRRDLPARLERAWCASPTMPRLLRWLGSSKRRATLRKRVAEALDACPRQAARQRALLHLLACDFASAARLLANAPGLGWSDGEHPGHLLFPLLARLLGASRGPSTRTIDPMSHGGMDLQTLDEMRTDPQEPQLIMPKVDALLRLTGIDGIPDAMSRATILAAMKKAAESRTAGVTEQKRSRHYGHAAELVATCVACDTTGETERWAATLKAGYRRFSALRYELDRASRTS